METHTQEIGSLVQTILPDKAVRLSCLETFASSIKQVDLHGSEKWGVYFTDDRIRLLVGNLIVCTVHKNAIWLALDAESLNASPEKQNQLDMSGAWKWDEHSYPEYSQIPSVNGYYQPHHADEATRRIVSELHSEFIDKVSTKYERLNARSQAKHDPSVIDYLTLTLDHFVPTPDDYADKSASKNPLAEIEELEPTYAGLRHTEREAIVQSRVGQGVFRKHLIQLWDGCAVTGCKEVSLLKASHIKPWRDSNTEERLDPYNGLLLVPNLDSAFDAGLITFSNDGEIVISERLSAHDRDTLGLHDGMNISRIHQRNIPYLEYHQTTVFE